MFRDTHCLSGGPRFNKKVHCKLQSHYFGFCFPFPKTLMFKSFSGIFLRKLHFSILKSAFSNGWSKSIFQFDFRSGDKKSGHLDYPLQSYGPKQVIKNHGDDFIF